ncbi:MAG: conjugal transfer protein TraX [Lachnospiraceae bacterium]|mgnify:CR=1 FL=1|nr:conjugal transfer protein TraX [Lachnospiraceae bacterium]
MYKGLTGSTLKWIAMITMFIDHVAATILVRHMLMYGATIEVYTVYDVMRNIGRVAFPIYCFLLVEGFLYTKNVYRYMGRMAVFLVLTEIPFDLAFAAKLSSWGYQSVMWTLLIGLITMWGCSLIEKKWPENYLIQWIGFALCLAAGMFLAYLLKTDYSYKGVIAIMAMYFFRKERKLQLLAGAVTFLCWKDPELCALLAFPLLYFYNGQRGMKMKYFFYAFYPAHLLILYLIAVILGNQFISVI